MASPAVSAIPVVADPAPGHYLACRRHGRGCYGNHVTGAATPAAATTASDPAAVAARGRETLPCREAPSPEGCRWQRQLDKRNAAWCALAFQKVMTRWQDNVRCLYTRGADPVAIPI